MDIPHNSVNGVQVINDSTDEKNMANPAGKPSVLIIDDEKGIRLGTKRLLESEGYIAETAEDGTEGIRLASQNEYDLVIIDLRMPDMDGMEVLKTIRKIYPNTVCFIATAYASYETAIESTKIGAYSYIPKPFTPEELLQQLSRGYEKRILMIEAEKLKKEREERLLEIAFEKTRLRTILNSINEGVLVVNKSGELVLFNSGALKYLDLNEIFIGDVILEILPPELTSLIHRYIDSSDYNPNSYTTQFEIDSYKEPLIIEATCSPVPQADGSLAGVVTVLRNITEARKVEAIKSQFVSMVAHELKTPMAAVIGFIRIILDKEINVSPEQQHDFLTRSYNRLQGLVAMVNDLLDISRMELKKTEREIKELDIETILRSIIELLEIEISKRSLSVNYNIHYSELKLKADQNEINRLFTNLISNAIKYNREKGMIDIDVKFSGNYMIAAIKDNGIGMKPEEQSRLFQEFYRVKNERTRGISGTGLGLSIVKRIIDSYSGKIEVESHYNEGTTFRVYLPLS